MVDRNPFTPVRVCRCCRGEHLTSVLDLGEMPLANGLHAGTPGPRFPLELLVCTSCWHGQLSGAVAGEALFTDYPYLSGVAGAFREHCRGLVGAAKALVTAERPAVLDIGCNDGTLLSLFRAVGCSALGVDPASNLKPRTDAWGIPVVNAFWGEGTATGLGRQFDIITAQNVFAHVPDLDDFLAGCATALASGGVVLLEFPHAADLIARGEFDTIYHEHLSYFTANSFARLVERSAFFIVGVARLSVHGGSLRFALRKGPGRVALAALDLIHDEHEAGLFDLATYRHFRFKVQILRRDFKRLLAGLRARGEKIVGYCASAKGAMALNYFEEDVEYVVDDTPMKQGRYLAGRSIPIVGPEVLAREPRKVNIVVLAWNWLEEIRGRIRTLRPGGQDRLIVYVPEVKEEGVES